MSKIQFSIIIPVYNVQNYLNQCVDSVLKQSYTNYEIVLVDDGSTDQSVTICDNYANQHKNIVVLHKQNGGLSSARNTGIKNANGDFILFLDSDDYWDSTSALQEIYNKIINTNCDIVNYGYKEFLESDNLYRDVITIPNLDSNVSKDTDIVKFMLTNGIYISSACVKAVKTSLIKNHSIYFVENVTSEDIDWSARLLLYSKKQELITSSFYVYRQRSGSITHTIKYENLEMLSKNIIKCIDYADNIKDIEYKGLYYNYVAYQYITFLHTSLRCEKNDKIKDLLNVMKQYSWVLKYNLNSKVKKVYLFKKIFGYKGMYYILSIYLKGR